MSPRFLLLPTILLATIPTALAADSFTVTVENDLSIARPAETIVIPWSEVASRLPEVLIDHLVVKDSKGKIIPSQTTNFNPRDAKGQVDELLFQHDFVAGEKSTAFTIEKTADTVPSFPSKTFARYIPERLDDFAWENDKLAHRIYGPGLDTPDARGERMISSGIDIWAKKVDYPIVDRWYLKGHNHYHKDEGEGLDFYTVGTSRGCGGAGIWDGKQLFTSHNWASWKILANGPIRTVFEITYAPWDAGTFKVAETKRFTVDAGSNLDQIDSTYTVEGGPDPITVAIGIAKHKDIEGNLTVNEKLGWMSLWEKYPQYGQLGCGVVLSPGTFDGAAENEQNKLILTKAKSGAPVRYYVGAGWEPAGDFATEQAWNAYLDDFAKRLASPLRILYTPRG
jgi:hypothetical protein